MESKIYLKARLFAELRSFGVAEVVVDERRVERRQQVEQRLAGNDVAENGLVVARHVLVAAVRGRHGPGSLPGAEAVASEAVLRRREGLERVRRPAVGVRVELFVQLLVSTDHLARVALDPKEK